MTVFDELVKDYEIPRMLKVKQNFPRPVLDDIPQQVKKVLHESGDLNKIEKGTRVAVTAGSRGIANIGLITKEVIGVLKTAGASPFIIPAMGSHGGATSEGQTEVLEILALSESDLGVPVKSSMEVVKIGTTDDNLPVYIDKFAATEADAIVVINRIKPHTTFRGPYESGLAKMITIGLGKQVGADLCHATGPENMSSRVEVIARHILKKTNLVFGVGILENAYDETCDIVVLPGEEIMEKEPDLLHRAWQNMPQIFSKDYDVLVVDEMGKDISGTGMDPNILGRYTSDALQDEDWVQRIVVLNLTERTHGNANGIGLADICTQKAFDKMDFKKTYPNCLTTGIVLSVKTPMVMENDRQAIKAAIKTCFDMDINNVKLIRIKNTLDLDQIYISEALLPEARESSLVEFSEQEPLPFAFNDRGDLQGF